MCFIVFLDATAAWRVVAGYGESDGALVTQVKLFLNQALAKRTASHNESAVIVLNSAGKNLAGTGRELINENYNLIFFK